MKCNLKEREENIQKYLNGDMPDAEMTAFEEHFLNCNDCMEELRDSLQLTEFIQKEGNVLFPEFKNNSKSFAGTRFKISDLIKKIFPPKWYIRPSLAYAFIAAALIIFGVYFLRPSEEINSDNTVDEQISSHGNEVSPQNDENSTVSNETEIQSTDQQLELYAANFIESDELEYLIGQKVRGSENIEVISPEPGITIKDEILFKWVIETEQKLYLKILNNKEDVLFQFTIPKNKLLFNITEYELDSGLYYWKLENYEELLHIGKFFVMN